MVRRMSERTQAAILLVVMALAIASLYGYVEATQPAPVQATSVSGVSLRVEGANWTIVYGPLTTTNNTVFGILMEASQRLGFPVEFVRYNLPDAVLVTAINSSANGQGGLFWQYWVDGVYGNVGADHYALANGVQVLWRFTTDQEGAA